MIFILFILINPISNQNITYIFMAEEEGKQQQPYQFTDADGVVGNSSKDYTGKGTATYPNGEVYQGLYQKGLRHGKGKYTYANGDKYEGQFRQNFKHGIGRIIYADKSEYYGQWQKGRKQGQGLYIYPNKDVFSGNWANGKKQGKGTYVFNATGMKYIGEWFQNKFLSGRWTYPNGTYYDGQFQNNQPKGNGTWNFNNGNSLNGKYNQLIVPNEDNTKLNIQLSWKA